MEISKLKSLEGCLASTGSSHLKPAAQKVDHNHPKYRKHNTQG
jgi:hypothetical protein